MNVYVSTVNGSIPMLVATIAAGTALYDYVTPGSVGREANQRYEEPIPAGVPFIHNSRLCTCSGTTIYIGLPARPGYYIPTDPRLEFASDVTNAISGQNGVLARYQPVAVRAALAAALAEDFAAGVTCA